MAEAICFVRDDGPGISRKGARRFRYFDVEGREVCPEDRVRIERLAIPPAWTNVWICPDPQGHIQATGRDARGRKQYRYHPAFRSRRERTKFRDLVLFGEALGGLRRRVDVDLRSSMLSRERVLAAITGLLDNTYIRIGNEAYAKTNKTYGLTTLRCKHVDVHGDRLHLHFTGKGGKVFDVTCCDARLARVVRRCHDLPGQVLFQYVNSDGVPCPVTSSDINNYLRGYTGIDATAKTFRTWGASLMAAQQLAVLETPSSETELRRVVKAALTPVAERLGNTVAVCRSSYVHPTVLTAFEKGKLAALWEQGPTRAANRLSVDERKLLVVLRNGR
jgi:DNA topoisomerase-1